MTGTYVGVPYWIPGGLTGEGVAHAILDENEDRMHTGRFWNDESNSHESGAGPIGGPKGRAYQALPLDWDADGDIDLVIGNDNGGLFLRENKGTAKEYSFSADCVALEAGGKPAVVPGGYAMPIAADWDGDGDLDLISGAKDGSVWWFQNQGATDDGTPRLAKPARLVGSAEDEGLGRGGSAQVEAFDLDGDGDLDLLVGDAHIEVVDGKLDAHGYVWMYRRGAKATPVSDR